MTFEVKTYCHKCDRCEKREWNHEKSLPPDWGRGYEYGCGLTNYTRELELCPKCYQEDKEKG